MNLFKYFNIKDLIDLLSINQAPGKGFELLLRKELENPGSPLYKLIFGENTQCRPYDKLSKAKLVKTSTLPSSLNPDTIYIPDDSKPNETGKHKADLILPYYCGDKISYIAVQMAQQQFSRGEADQNYNLWNKAKTFFEAIKTQLKSEETIFVFASYYDFDTTGRNIPQNCRVIKGKDFKNCIFPFDLLQTRDLDLSKELFRKYFQKLGIDIKTISLFGNINIFSKQFPNYHYVFLGDSIVGN